MNLRRLSPVPLLLLTLLLPAACAQRSTNGLPAPSALDAQKAPEPAATATPATLAAKEEAPETLEAQLAALAAAEGQIAQVLGDGAKKVGERDEVGGRTPAGGPRPGAARGGVAPGKPAAGEMEKVGSSCALACSALASMNRAVSHLCALAGEGDRRCEDGRTRERSATQRVHASCPSCGG
ncbi:MAG: hypothetical protein ABI193_10035 [Minicystis sp.]